MQRCVFSLDSCLFPADENYLENVIYSCEMPLDSHNLYTPRTMYCMSLIENAFYLKKEIVEFICVHCGSFDIDIQAM